MYRIENILLLLILIITSFSFSQEKKETIYLFFDTNNKEKCIIEDGSGNSTLKDKYRKEYAGKYIDFKICHEQFRFYKNSKTDTCIIKSLDNLKIVDIEYIKRKKSETILKYNPFKKVVLIEIISSSKIIKYNVKWIDDWVLIED